MHTLAITINTGQNNNTLRRLEHQTRSYHISSIALVASGILLQVISGYWDVYSHRATFQLIDPWWNPAHLSLYSGFAVVLAASFMAIRNPIAEHQRVLRIGPHVVLVGAAIEIFAGAWNEIWHALHLPEPPIAPAHALVVIGMLVVSLGAILSASTMLVVIKNESENYSSVVKGSVLFSLLVAFLSIWLLSAGSAMYVAGVYRDIGGYFAGTVSLAWITPMVLVPAMRAVGRFGFVTSMVAGYVLINYVLLVGYLGEALYVPLGIISGVLIEGSYFSLRRLTGSKIAALFAGFLSGPLVLLTYHPFTPSVITVSWTASLQLTLAGSAIAGFVGGLTGYAAVDLFRLVILRSATSIP